MHGEVRIFIMYTDQIETVYRGQWCSISVHSSEYQEYNNDFVRSVTILPSRIKEELTDLNPQ